MKDSIGDPTLSLAARSSEERLGTLSKDVFERRTSTGSEASPFLYASTLTNFYC